MDNQKLTNSAGVETPHEILSDATRTSRECGTSGGNKNALKICRRSCAGLSECNEDARIGNDGLGISWNIRNLPATQSAVSLLFVNTRVFGHRPKTYLIIFIVTQKTLKI